VTDLEIALRELHHAIYLDPDPEELEGIRERAEERGPGWLAREL
jgi:hypothetical protein